MKGLLCLVLSFLSLGIAMTATAEPPALPRYELFLTDHCRATLPVRWCPVSEDEESLRNLAAAEWQAAAPAADTRLYDVERPTFVDRSALVNRVAEMEDLKLFTFWDNPAATVFFGVSSDGLAGLNIRSRSTPPDSADDKPAKLPPAAFDKNIDWRQPLPRSILPQ